MADCLDTDATRTMSCRQRAVSSRPREADGRRIDIGPLNAYDRCLVHLAGGRSQAGSASATAVKTVIMSTNATGAGLGFDSPPNVRLRAMLSTADPIVAIATPPGRGGIGVVRLSGASALEVSGALLPGVRLAPRRATFARVSSDHVVATYFPAPRSYTGEDVVEISAHGSPVVLGQIVAAAMDAGARLAEPGEFTLRAFLNGRMDLIQAEAVADLIDAVTPLQARAAFDQLQGTLTQRMAELDRELFDLMARLEASLDFPDEGYHFIQPAEVADALRQLGARLDTLLADAQRGRLIREGAQVAIVGTPNVGKSSLFNALLQTARAIVTPIPGTTRDLVTATVDVEGLRLQLADTAGMREASDEVEREGVIRAKHAWMTAELVVVVLDVSRPLGRDDRADLHDTAAARRSCC